jgi:lipopolysaccharide biosynthesis glycosyltransferase
MSTLHVACAVHGDYVPHSATMLHSVLAHRADQPVAVHYLHGPDLAAGARRRLAEMVSRGGGCISFVPVAEEAVAGLPAPGYFSRAMWYRILLPDLLPDLDQVLYLDADTVVLDSLEPLWATELRGNYVAAVTNVFEPHHLGRPGQLGLAGPEVYFNTGVLLMDLALMRLDGCTEALRRFALDHEDLLWPDQDAFNVVLGHRRLELHPRWNCMNSVMHMEQSIDVFGGDAVTEARQHPAIRHFEGPSINKPWHYLCERSMREVYFDHRRQTPWPRCRLEGGGVAARARRLGRSLRRRASASARPPG